MAQTKSPVAPSVINLYVIAENRLLREALVRVLKKSLDLAIVGEADLSASATDRIVASECHILLLDSLGTYRGIRLVTDVLEAAPSVRVLPFGMDESPDCFTKAVRAGISGYILKDASAGEMIAAIRDVAAGEVVCPPKLCKVLFQAVRRNSANGAKMVDTRTRRRRLLTYRQRQLLSLVAQGLTNKEIAINLNLSEYTVKNHMHRIMRIVDAQNRYEAADLCVSQETSAS